MHLTSPTKVNTSMTADVRINLTPNTQAKVQELTAAKRTLVENALVGYLDKVAHLRQLMRFSEVLFGQDGGAHERR